MGRWLAKLILPIWIGIYLFSLVPRAIIAAPVFAWVGLRTGLLINFLAILVWGIIFYLLLLPIESLDKFREHLAQLEMRWEQSFLKKVVEQVRNEPLVSPWWVFLVFIASDVFGGVIVIRLNYPPKLNRKVLALIIVGCALDVLTWTLPVYGGLGLFIRKLREMMFGGG